MVTTFSIAGLGHGQIQPPATREDDFRFQQGDLIRLNEPDGNKRMLRVSSVVIAIHDRNEQWTQEVSLSIE